MYHASLRTSVTIMGLTDRVIKQLKTKANTLHAIYCLHSKRVDYGIVEVNASVRRDWEGTKGLKYIMKPFLNIVVGHSMFR